MSGEVGVRNSQNSMDPESTGEKTVMVVHVWAEPEEWANTCG